MRLSEYLDGGIPPIAKQGVSKPIVLNNAVRKLLEVHPEIDGTESDDDIEALLKRLDICRQKYDWTGIKWRHVASAARALFKPPFSKQKRWKPLQELMLETLEYGDKRSFARASFSAYLQGFDPESSLTRELARKFRKTWQQTMPQTEPLVERFELFKVRGLERRIGEFLAGQELPFDALRELGVTSPHMPGLFQRGFQHFVDSKAKSIESEDQISVEQILHWLAPDSDTILRDGHGHAVAALLLPWVNMTPAEDIQTLIRSELVAAYGDPRIGSTYWDLVPEDARSVIRRWLTGSSLRQFLQIVSSVEGSHMWAPRRKFWEGMHAQDLIDEAWVILSNSGAAKASELAKLQDDESYRSHGRISNSGSDQTCYLVMRCGRSIVVEGSHNFSIRFYDRDNERRPSLYQIGYDRWDFHPQSASSRVPHLGNWQHKASVNIARLR